LIKFPHGYTFHLDYIYMYKSKVVERSILLSLKEHKGVRFNQMRALDCKQERDKVYSLHVTRVETLLRIIWGEIVSWSWYSPQRGKTLEMKVYLLVSFTFRPVVSKPNMTSLQILGIYIFFLFRMKVKYFRGKLRKRSLRRTNSPATCIGS